MLRASKLKTIVRVIALVLLLATSLGPWFADSHPATAETCSPPLVWLGDGYCACLITLKEYVMEAGIYGRDVIWSLCVPPALPVLSTLLLFLFGERRWLRVCHLSAWGIAGIYALLWFGGVWVAHRGVLVLWGAGLGGLVAVAALVGERLIGSSTKIHGCIACLTILFVFSACMPKESPLPRQAIVDTLVPTATIRPTNTPSSLPTNTPTITQTDTPWWPSITPRPTKTITPTPLPMLEAPAGIVYQTDTGLYVTQGMGNATLLYELGKHETASFSPDGSYVLLSDFSNQYLVDMGTSNKTKIWPRDDYNVCPFSWVDRQPLVMISVLLPEGADPGYSCNRGSPVLLYVDGTIVVFDKQATGYSAPHISPDNQSIAYDLDGVPWLYSWENGSRPFDVTSFGFPNLGKIVFSDPTWSPSGRKIAWTYRTEEESEDLVQQGLAIFNLDTKKSTDLKGYYVREYEGSRPNIVWNRDESYIVMWHYQLPSQDFVWDLMSVDGSYARTLEGLFDSWSPSSDLFAIINYKEDWKLYIESPDGSVSTQICCGRDAQWSPEGKQLLSWSGDGEFWITDVETRSVAQINLPADAEIVDWKTGQ